MTEAPLLEPGPKAQVWGYIRRSDRSPAPGVTVCAFACELRAESEIGRAVSDEFGHYIIAYPQVPGGILDLRVKALQSDGTMLVASPVTATARAEVMVDLVLPKATALPPSYARLIKAIEPRLGTTALAELTTADVQHLAAVTGERAQLVQRLVDSARCAQALNGGTQQTAHMTSMVFALLSQGLPSDPHLLGRQPSAAIAQALARSAQAGLVEPPSVRWLQRLGAASPVGAKRVTSGAAAWPELLAEHLARRRLALELAPAVEGQPLTVADLFATPGRRRSAVPGAHAAPLSAAKQRILAACVAKVGALHQVDASELAANDFSAAEIRAVQRMAALSDLTQHHRPAAHALNAAAQLRGTPADGTLACLAHLVDDDWQRIVESTDAPVSTHGDTPHARMAAYARKMEAVVESRFRTAVLATRIARGRVAVANHLKSEVVAFFADNPDFELGQRPLLAKLSEVAGANTRDAASAAGLQRELLAIERTFKLTDNHRQHNALLAAGLDSAHKIARIGRRDMLHRLSSDPQVGAAAAASIVRRAERTAAVAVSTLMAYRDPGISLPVMSPSGFVARAAEAPTDSVLRQVPDLASLFGSLDSGACEPCRSVLSPSAYFVDILKFLEDRKAILAIRQPPVNARPYAIASGGVLVLAVAGRCTQQHPEKFEVQVVEGGSTTGPFSVAVEGTFQGRVTLTPGAHALSFVLRRKGDTGGGAICSVARSVLVVVA